MTISHFGRIVAAVALVLGAASVSAADVAAAAGSSGSTCDPAVPSTCTLGDLARRLDLRIGATLEDFEISNADYTATLRREFTSVTPENALKLYSTQPERGSWQFAAGDAVVGFASDAGLEVRGHTLVWAKDEFTPSWVTSISDSTALRQAVEEHVAEVMGHYAGRVRRWDVVNEPLDTFGTGPSASVFWTMGADWIDQVFRLAHTIDPDAELWINEYGTDWVPGKHAALVALVSSLVSAGVPVDGVGIQMHRLPGVPLDQAVLERQLRDFTALGLEVAITELDVPVSPTDSDAFAFQAEEYRKVVAACVAVPGCSEITVWGLTDGDTWLDGLGLFPTPTRPLLFDSGFQPKPAYAAVRDELAAAVRRRSMPVTGGNSFALLSVALAAMAGGVVLHLAAVRRRRRAMRFGFVKHS
ncbi:MAG: endo-1,4-beta-xylanase [Ilumatobacteraceae bacterium]